MIFRRKGDIRAIDNRGRTILHSAAMCGNLAAVKRVMELGGANDLWSMDSDGRTPSQLASTQEALHITEYLDQKSHSDQKEIVATGGFTTIPESSQSCRTCGASRSSAKEDIDHIFGACFEADPRFPKPTAVFCIVFLMMMSCGTFCFLLAARYA